MPHGKLNASKLNLALLAVLTLMTLALSIKAPVSAHWPDLLKVLVATVAMQLLRIRYKKINEPPLVAALDGASLVIVFATIYTIATYMGATYSATLWDATFMRWDAALGLDASKIVMWVRGIPWLDTILKVAYTGFFLQFGLYVPYTAGVRRQPERMHQGLAQIFICAIISLVCFTLMPSLNTIVSFGYEDQHQLQEVADHILRVREGKISVLKFEEGVQGLIQLPSMHAALAVLFAWDLRHDPKPLFITYVLWNVLVVFSAIPMGAHYVVDVIAGVVMAIIAIVLVSTFTIGPKDPSAYRPPPKPAPTPPS